MKTKHLLTALMLPAVFAACTQEEVVSNTVQMNERIEVGQIALGLGGAESRFAAGTGDSFNGFVPADGDVLGAALVDNATSQNLVYNKNTKVGHMENYTLTSNINTNYAYTKAGEIWKSEANMVEGNYLFYLPYNADHTTRTPLVAKLPVTQILEVGANGVVKESLIDYALEQGSIMGLGYTFVDRDDDNTVDVDMLPIYAYPLVKLVNSYKEDLTPNDGIDNKVGLPLTIKRVVVKNTKDFTVTAPINAGNNTALNTTSGAVKEFHKGGIKVLNATEDAYVEVNTGSYADYADKTKNYVAFTSSLLGAATTKSPALVVKPSQTYTLQPGTSSEFYLVIPAEDYDDNTLVIEVTTDKGTFAKTIVNPAIAAGKRYPLSEYVDGQLISPVLDPDGSSAIAAGKGSEYCVKMGENTRVSESIMVTTTAELVAELQNAVEDAVLNVTTLSKDVCFDAAAARAFKANKNANFNLIVNGELTFTSGLASGTVITKTINIMDNAYINGNVTINKQITWGEIGNANTKDVAVVEAGNVTIESIGSLFGQMSIKSGATVTIKQGTAAFGVVNAGTLNVYEDVDLKSNTGTVNVGHENATDAQKLSLTWMNNFINSANGTVNVYNKFSVDNLTNAGTVNNYGTITGLDNSGTVNNYSSVTGENTNLIVLQSVNASLGTITGAGYIKNNIDINNVIDVTTMTNQKVYYEFEGGTINGALYPQTGQYNTIILNGATWAPTASQDLTGTNKATLIELKGATISIYTPGVVVTLPKVYCEGINTWKGNSQATINYAGKTIKNGGDSNNKLNIINVKAVDSTASVTPSTPTEGEGTESEGTVA